MGTDREPITAYYRRWGCDCERHGTAILAAVETEPRPEHLPEDYPWPPQSLRCDCGGTLNLMRPKDRPEFFELAPEMFSVLEQVADAERVLVGILDRRLPGWRQNFRFEEMFLAVREMMAKARRLI